MQAAQRAIASANSQIEAAKAERLPTFQVAFTTGFVGIDPPKTIAHNFGGSYDGVMSLPVFDGGLIASHIDQAKAKAHSATAQARQAEYILKRRVADASLRYDEAKRQLDILSRAQPTADDNFGLTWSRFLGGGIRDDARGAGLLSAGRAIAAPALRPGIQRARSGGGDQPALRPYPVMKRADANCRAIAIFAAMLAIATSLLSGCGGGKKPTTKTRSPANPTLLVSAARAEVHPMTSELRLLGKTVAMRHVIIRAPTAGRVTGMKLVSGDSVRKGQVVAHVINREIEAAEAGLAVARKIDPQDAPGLTASVAALQSQRGNTGGRAGSRESSRSRRSPAARWWPTSTRLSI